jgi:hypothetical protein
MNHEFFYDLMQLRVDLLVWHLSTYYLLYDFDIVSGLEFFVKTNQNMCVRKSSLLELYRVKTIGDFTKDLSFSQLFNETLKFQLENSHNELRHILWFKV